MSPKVHRWVEFPGRLPLVVSYLWCRDCGTLKVRTPASNPDEHYQPGANHPVSDDPGCAQS